MKKNLILPIVLLSSIVLLLTTPILTQFLLQPINPREATNITQNNYYKTQQEDEKIATTHINLTFTDSTTEYYRTTDIEGAENLDPHTEFFAASADLTTHDELLFTFHFDINPDNWNSNLTLFKKSFFVEDIRDNYRALQEFARVNISLLDIKSSAFEVFTFLKPDFRNPENPSRTVFGIDQRIIVRETTAFVLGLDEVFPFDLNQIQLGQMQDFHLISIFDSVVGESSFFHESLQIIAPGSPLTQNVDDGYDGELRFSNYEPQEVGPYRRQFLDVNQSVDMSINLPKEQKITYTLNYGPVPSSEVNDINMIEDTITQHKNVLEFMVSTDDFLPSYIKISSFIPFLDQFSLTDYLYYAFGAFTALFGALKGLPFVFNRLQHGKFRRNLFSSAKNKNWEKLDELVKQAKDDYLNRKLTLKEFENIKKEAQYLKHLQSNKESDTQQ